MPVFENKKKESLNFMDCALKNLENMSLDDAQLKQRQTKPNFINGDHHVDPSTYQNQIAYEDYLVQLEQNLSRTRNQRIKNTLFPELFEDEDIDFTQLANCNSNSTNVQKLADCAQVFLAFFFGYFS